MVIYLDTSALLKLHVDEDDRELVAEATQSAKIAVSTVVYAEARAGLARRLREGDFTDQEHRDMVAALDEDWRTFDRLHVSSLIAYYAGQLAQQYALRGYDAIHLALAKRFAQRFEELRFMAFDRRLANAASEAGVRVYPD